MLEDRNDNNHEHTSRKDDYEMKRLTMIGVWCAMAVVCATGTAGPAAAQQQPAETVVGPVKCAECHKSEARIWEGTHHFRTFTELPRKDTAREIADKMEIRRIKADSECLGCHFTSQIVDGDEKTTAGISCESCHGGAQAWLKRHSEFSGHEKAEQESAEEAATRWADAEAAGMIRPQDIYLLAKNCYSCHVVPKEDLVNTGGHPAGSPFELVAWSQGEIRHNSWYSPDKSNRKASADRKRVFFVVGTAVELEVSLRAVAVSTQKARYAVSMAKRAQAAKVRMTTIAGVLSVPEIDEIVAAASGAALKLNNEAELTAAADKIAAATRKLAANYDGSTWSAVDGMIPGEDKYKGSPVEVPMGAGNGS